jgi:hypothetical protein
VLVNSSTLSDIATSKAGGRIAFLARAAARVVTTSTHDLRMPPRSFIRFGAIYFGGVSHITPRLNGFSSRCVPPCLGDNPSGKFTCNRPGGSYEEALYYHRSVLGHDLGLCRQRMRSRFVALELQLVGIERRVHVLELRFAALEQLVPLGLRFTTPTVQFGGVELQFE